MKTDFKKILLAILGGIGVVAFLTGIFTDFYDFSTGIWLAVIIWALTGIIGIIFGVNKRNSVIGRKFNKKRKK